MRVKCEIGNGPVTVEAWVNLADREVFCVMWFGLNILQVLEVETLDKIVEAAEAKFKRERSEP
jgi:hypothetical protein